ncbi:hypothetical protein ACJMK2_000919 [Sinanodonta woodiana]|uniref:RING-type domain-containing protein n=1 Tax=Sinanodonta woodiana TaxID=1069815 RepID=A0ABD3XU56_SINWO
MATASEDLIASDEIQENEATLSEDLNCPLCMKIFRSPRRLPCLHSFCHDCLQYIRFVTLTRLRTSSLPLKTYVLSVRRLCVFNAQKCMEFRDY